MTHSHVIAWDIETVPQPEAELTDRQRRRYELALADELKRSPESDPVEAGRKVRSLHPMLGRICVLSAVRMDTAGIVGSPTSYVAEHADEEGAMLARFWTDVARLPRNVVWVTFNGKRFDVDWLKVRSAAAGLIPSRRDLLDTYPFKNVPHCDLSRAFDCRAGLDDLCDLLGVSSPKGDLDGSGVAAAIEAGRIEDVMTYCERDVVATLEVYRRMSASL